MIFLHLNDMLLILSGKQGTKHLLAETKSKKVTVFQNGNVEITTRIFDTCVMKFHEENHDIKRLIR